jgi:Flp pilus assembly protein TadG
VTAQASLAFSLVELYQYFTTWSNLQYVTSESNDLLQDGFATDPVPTKQKGEHQVQAAQKVAAGGGGSPLVGRWRDKIVA